MKIVDHIGYFNYLCVHKCKLNWLFEDVTCIVVGVVVDLILLVTNQHVDMHVGCNKYFVFASTCEGG